MVAIVFFPSYLQENSYLSSHDVFQTSERMAEWPSLTLAQARNGLLDWAFYDVSGLTSDEFAKLSNERSREGSILVVWPTIKDNETDQPDQSIQKFANHAELRAAPGELVRRFCIAGVGSSDIGAAAFARTIANHYQEPVGAIVAGYGMADLVSEAMGGWFVLGSANRFMQIYHRAMADAETLGDLSHVWQQPFFSLFSNEPSSLQEIEAKCEADDKAVEEMKFSNRCSDTQTLLALLNDEDRTILSLCGHSKGCLSIAYALEQLVLSKQLKVIRKAGEIRITTAGAVVALPKGFTNVGQYLGSLDWFGGMNSRTGLDHVKIEDAWHHLNTQMPNHMDFAQVLQREP